MKLISRVILKGRRKLAIINLAMNLTRKENSSPKRAIKRYLIAIIARLFNNIYNHLNIFQEFCKVPFYIFPFLVLVSVKNAELMALRLANDQQLLKNFSLFYSWWGDNFCKFTENLFTKYFFWISRKAFLFLLLAFL